MSYSHIGVAVINEKILPPEDILSDFKLLWKEEGERCYFYNFNYREDDRLNKLKEYLLEQDEDLWGLSTMYDGDFDEGLDNFKGGCCLGGLAAVILSPPSTPIGERTYFADYIGKFRVVPMREEV